MRLLYDARLASRGLGIATVVVELARALAASGEAELVWFGDPRSAPAGIAVLDRADRLPYPLLDGTLGRALARRLGVDLVHFTGNTGWGRRGPVPCVLTLHDLIFMESDWRSRSLRQIVGHRYERLQVPRAARTADVIVVPSRTVAAQVGSRLPLATPPRVVSPGVEPCVGVSPRVGAPVSPVPYLVAFAGRDPRKLTDEVVRAWRQLSTLPVRLHLLAAGGTPPGLLDSLGRELERGDLEIHGHLPRREVWSLLTGALALIYPSRDEGFGLPVLEGMAAGIPVLSGIARCTREVGGDAIIQLDASDVVGSIVAAVRCLLAHPAQARAAAERGLARVRTFTWEATAEGYLRAYRDAIERVS